ncbi:iron-siderophore ABC transporter substrate-binding protein [Naasia sp. SYSU D00948]|uniref:iron-siderophore ABC transporter substrate-binding protein n=1 Tax=Naasia sp. SYSU D00948 TaxID=2817379 RepID=UPI0027DD6ED5|nr:iron-siderophore ABC transporter substrate-binding protein [Naasia sp. SYSU D00948]
MLSLRRPAIAAALTLSGALLLTACSSTTPASDGGSAGGGGFPVTVEHAYGATEVPEQPERVATVAWGNQDVALALGVVPVGMPFVTYADDNGDGILPWVQDALDELGGETPELFDEVDGINFEQVADTAPDLILGANSGLTEEEYQTLTEIAPTVSFPGEPWLVDWRESTTLNGAALGLADEADELVADTEQLIADAAAAHPELQGTTFAYLWVDPGDTSSVYVYLPEDARVSFLADLGMEPSAGVQQLAAENEGQFFATLTAENLDVLADADIILNYGGEDTLAAMQAEPLLGALPAVQAGAVAIVTESDALAAAMTTPTVLSIPWGIDEYTQILADAAAKVQ